MFKYLSIVRMVHPGSSSAEKIEELILGLNACHSAASVSERMNQIFVIHPDLFAGGSGLRLWQLFRKFHTKQFSELSDLSRVFCSNCVSDKILDAKEKPLKREIFHVGRKAEGQGIVWTLKFLTSKISL